MRRVFLAATAALISVSLGTARVGAEPFRNLDFEASVVSPASPSLIAPWMAHIGSEYSFDEVPLNAIALDTTNITLIDLSSRGWQPIEGQYAILLQGGTWQVSPDEAAYRDASISQTGDIPANAQSLRMLVHSSFGSLWKVSLDGNDVPMFALKDLGGGVWEYGGDVRAFAGSTSELVLSTSEHWENTTLFDSIRFSPEPVPEPSSIVLALAGFASFLVARKVKRCWRSGGRSSCRTA